MNEYSITGSEWHRWDLHFHTPSSYDYQGTQVTNEQIVSTLLKNNVRVVAITDHHKMDIERIADLQRIAQNQLTVLPGIELRSDQGGKPIHYICLFPENSNLEHLKTRLEGSLRLTEQDITSKGGDHMIYVPIKDAHPIVQELDGLISIHAGEKSNSIEEISNREQFQRRIKYDITKKYVDVLEIGQIKDVDRHLNVIFPATKIEKPLIICSDNHDIKEYKTKVPLWIRAEPSFCGLRMIVREPRERVCLEQCPVDITRVDTNPTKYIKRVSFSKKEHSGRSKKVGIWFREDIHFNSGLIAIIGNKGSGKSALADILGLLGGSKNNDHFSFLNTKRFREPKSGLASQFKATLEWKSGEEITYSLDEDAPPEALERIKYLPQKHIEDVCNEIVNPTSNSSNAFEIELKSVIFSHVPSELRLNQLNLDDLIEFKTTQKQGRIDSLIGQLRGISRRRSDYEEMADDIHKKQLRTKITQCQAEIEAHKNLKPKEVLDPAIDNTNQQANKAWLEKLNKVNDRITQIEEELTKREELLRDKTFRRAVITRLLEKIAGYEEAYGVFIATIENDLATLGIDRKTIINVSIYKTQVEKMLQDIESEISDINKLLSVETPDGLKQELIAQNRDKLEIQSQLDAPNRLYHEYLSQLKGWEERLAQLEKDEKSNESLVSLQKQLENLEKLPSQIEELKQQQRSIALDIQKLKIEQTKIYHELFQPVQDFIGKHEMGKDKLHLEFSAQLSNSSFENDFLEMINLGRRGSFSGADESKARVKHSLATVLWDERDSLLSFLEDMDTAVHVDLRAGTKEAMRVQDQLKQGKSPEDLYNLLYGLSYLNPKYSLLWQGKDLLMLSPGERGTLLLIFYLLIDKDDTPLIIDQPEENLDNHTVAKVLVDCIREARKRRQVIMVTHNPNLAVVCDADQIIHAKIDKQNGNSITYSSGALENPDICEYVTDVLEGTLWAFDMRGQKYQVSKHNEQ